MEIFLVICVAGGFFVVAFSKRRSDSSTNQGGSPPPRPSEPRRQSTDEVKDAQQGRFDEKSAKHLDHARVLSGPAWIVDGDTIKIKSVQVRLFGIDAPELNHPYGKQAKWALHKLCKGHTIRAEITEEDAYGRTVAKCFLPDGRDLSAELVKMGLALDWPKFSGGVYTSLEPEGVRKKHWKATARQRGHMHVFNK